MKIGLIFTLVYGRINYRLDYFCFLAGVIFSLIVNFMFSTSTSITLLSPNHCLLNYTNPIFCAPL